MPESDKIKDGTDKIEIPKVKKGVSYKFIIIGVAGYLSVLVLMIVGMVYFLKPDVTPVVRVQPVVNTTTVPNKSAQNNDLNDPDTNAPDIDKAVQDFVNEPESVDISDIVAELKEIEYKSNLRHKMELASIAQLQAERETKIAQARLQELKIQTAKLIAARPKAIAAVNEPENEQVLQVNALVSTESLKGFKKLAKIYSSMRPTDAAKILEKMETKLVVNLLTNMKGRNAAKILSSFSPTKAARISKKISDKLAQI